MAVEERIVVATPEGVDLELQLAGVGSRFIAALLDVVIQGAIIFALAFGLGVATAASGGLDSEDDVSGWLLAAFTIASFLVIVGYDMAFELLGGGRTPGKRANKLRVLQADGRPIGFLSSAIRNLLRIVDFLPVFYVSGAITISVTERNQRLGDLAAGTLVIRERTAGRTDHALAVEAWSASATVPPDAVAGWDVSGITDADLDAIRHFLTRRLTLPIDARWRLANDLAARLAPRVPGAPTSDTHPEFLLEGILIAKQSHL